MKARKQELDFLRIFACLLVISSHLVYAYALDINCAQWEMANIYYVGRNACVPLFFALSGVLLLGKSEFSTRSILKKILFYAALYIIGCTFYNLWGTGNLPITLKTILSTVVPGMKNPMLMWYLAELCGIYAFIPILAKIAQNEKLCKYYLGMWVIYNFAIRNIPTWLAYLGNDTINDVASVFGLFNAKEFLTYSGYLVMGYYLYHYFNKHVKGWMLLSILLVSVAAPAFFNYLIVTSKGVLVNSVYDYNGFSALFQTGCYVLIAKQYLSKLNMNERCRQLLSEISACTFGIYLIHAIFTGKYLYKIAGNILLRTPVVAISIFLACCIVVAVVRRGKELVVRKWRACSWRKRKFLISLCVIWLGVFMITLYNCGLYGDGSAIVLYLLSRGKLLFPDIEPFILARRGVSVLTRIFTYALARVGITDAGLLTYACSFGSIFWFGLFTTASLYICYKYHSSEKLLNHTIILNTMVLAFGGLYCSHQSFMAISILWFVFTCVYCWEDLSKRTGWVIVLIVVLLFCLSGTYESFGVMGPAILVYYFAARIKCRDRVLEKKSFIVIALILINSVYEFYWILHPDNPGAEIGLVNTLFQQDRMLMALLVCLALFLICVEMVPKTKGKKFTVFFEVALAFLMFVYMVCNPLRIASDCRVARNIFNIIVPFLFVLYEILLLFAPKGHTYGNNILTVALSVACLITVFGFSSGYNNYLRSLNEMTGSAYGFVAWDPTDENDAYNTDWPTPNESVLASILFSDDNTIHSVVVENPEKIYFQHYDTWDIHAYPDLAKYGITYDTEVFEPVLHREETAGELFHICFTDGTNSAMKYITEGISLGEPGFTWTDGNCLKMKPVQIDSYSGEYSYTLTLNIGGTYHSAQEIIVSCSDQEVFKTSVQEEGGTIAIPVYADEQGLIDIKVELPDAVSPDEIEGTGDVRKLAIMLLDAFLTAEI